jgi:hypothetical protein
MPGLISLTTPLLSGVDTSAAEIAKPFEAGAYGKDGAAAFGILLVKHCAATGMNARILGGQVRKETANFKYGGQAKAPQFNFAGIGTTNDGAAGHSFGSMENGVMGLCAHHGNYLFGEFKNWPKAWEPYKAFAIRNKEVLAAGYGGVVKVLGDYTNGRWAWSPQYPKGTLQNGYATGIATLANQFAVVAQGGTKVMGHVPQPPITNHIIGIPPKVNGVGVDRISTKRTPKATVLHSMGGTLSSCDGYFPGPKTEALTDFGVGQTDFNRSGFAQIIQWTDIFGYLMPWASGPVRNPEGDGPAFLAKFGGAEAVNNVGVSIEHDDTTLADGSRTDIAGAAVTLYQWSASIWLQAWLHAEVFGQTSETYAWNMWHQEFCGAAYKTCPRDRIKNYVEEYQAAVKAEMDHFQKGTPYPAGGLKVAGMRINTPPEIGVVTKEPIVVAPDPQSLDVDVPGIGKFTIVQPILTYWKNCGGVNDHANAPGYPISGMFEQDNKLVQYFERARIEVAGTQIYSGLIGHEALAKARAEGRAPQF